MKNVIEKLHLKRLEDKGIVIEEIFKNVKENTIYIRTSDGKECDSFTKCPKIERNYYLNGKLLYRETDFDQHVLYSYNTAKDSVEKCTECGYEAPSKEFFDGCPYCGSQFNVEYNSTSRHTSGKVKSMFMDKYDRLLILGVTIISLPIMYLMAKSEETGVNAATLLNSFFTTFVTLIVAFYPTFYFIKLMLAKDFPHSPIRINGRLISSMTLLRDLQSELKKYYYYKNPKYYDLVDYEIIEYTDFNVDQYSGIEARIKFYIKVKQYYLVDNQIISEIDEKELIMKQNILNQEQDKKMNKCPRCGASVDGLRDICDYCHKKITPNKQWILEKII